MTDESLHLYISGGAHITRPNKRIEEIENAVETIDTVFLESPRANPPSLRTRVSNAIATPLILVGLYIWVGFLKIAGSITDREDIEIISHLEEKYDVSVVRIDRNVHRLLSEERLLWAAGHYLICFLAVFGLPLFVSTQLEKTPMGIRIIAFFVILAAGMFALFVASTLQVRNMVIAREIEQFAKRTSGTTACLIIGGAHATGIEKMLKDSDYVKIRSSHDSD